MRSPFLIAPGYRAGPPSRRPAHPPACPGKARNPRKLCDSRRICPQMPYCHRLRSDWVLRLLPLNLSLAHLCSPVCGLV